MDAARTKLLDLQNTFRQMYIFRYLYKILRLYTSDGLVALLSPCDARATMKRARWRPGAAGQQHAWWLHVDHLKDASISAQ